MADVVSDLVLSFFCCCFYGPGDLRGVGGAHHYGGGHAHPAGRNAACCHRAAGGRGRRVSLQVRASSLQIISTTIISSAAHVKLDPEIQTVELKVRMCCDGCERVVRQALRNLRGMALVSLRVAGSDSEPLARSVDHLMLMVL